MKKILIIVLMALPFIVSAQSQKVYLDTANVFHTYLESGIGEQVPISFKIDKIDKIKQTTIYTEWEKETFTNPANAKYVADHKSMQNIELFLMTKLESASSIAKQSMKNRVSYSSIKGSVGSVIGAIKLENKDWIFIDIPVQSQNGYGNIVMSSWNGVIRWNKEANKEEITGTIY